MVVDSCLDASDQIDRRPVAEKYLRALGVKLEDQVDLIVATHWHADHIAGLGRLVEICETAVFSCANVLVREEFQVFAEQMATGDTATDGAKLREFRHAIRHLRSRKQTIRFATGGKTIKSWLGTALHHGEDCFVRSFSPSDKEYALFLAEIARTSPAHGEAKRSAVPGSPNLVSVVLHVELRSFAMLLGADMESHNDPARGWTAAVAEGQTSRAAPADLLKIPHHGSETGHHPQMWSKLLAEKPIGVVTPFNRLPDSKKLPTSTDIARLKAATGDLYSTSELYASENKGRDAVVERGIRESGIIIRDLIAPLGLVRCRRSTNGRWRTETFPPAFAIR